MSALPTAACTAVFNQGAVFIGNYRTWFDEELLNLSAVETLEHGGKAFELPVGLMPEGEGSDRDSALLIAPQ